MLRSRSAPFGPPALDCVGPMPFPALQSMFDALYPPGLQWYWKADFVSDLSDEAIALHVEYGARLPTMHSTMHLYPINGAAHRVGTGRHRLQLPRRQLRRGHRRRRPRPGQQRRITAWTQRLLGGPAPVLGRRRLRQLHDGRGRRSASRPPTATTTRGWPQIKAQVRPRQPLPRQPEHRPGGDRRSGQRKISPGATAARSSRSHAAATAFVHESLSSPPAWAATMPSAESLLWLTLFQPWGAFRPFSGIPARASGTARALIFGQNPNVPASTPDTCGPARFPLKRRWPGGTSRSRYPDLSLIRNARAPLSSVEPADRWPPQR